ncbi:hypothetical protein D3C72_1622980 [compost metagenome]
MRLRNQKLVLFRNNGQFFILLSDDFNIIEQNRCENQNSNQPKKNEIFYKILSLNFFFFQRQKFFVVFYGFFFFSNFKFLFILQNLAIVEFVIIIFRKIQPDSQILMSLLIIACFFIDGLQIVRKQKLIITQFIPLGQIKSCQCDPDSFLIIFCIIQISGKIHHCITLHLHIRSFCGKNQYFVILFDSFCVVFFFLIVACNLHQSNHFILRIS